MLILKKIIEYGQSPHTTLAALSETTFLELIVQYSPVIDPDRAGFNFTGYAKRPVDIARPDIGGKAVGRRVRQFNRLDFAVKPLHGQYRAEYLVLNDIHVRVHGFDKRRPVERAFGEWTVHDRTAADHNFSPSRDCIFNYCINAIDTGAINERPHFGVRIGSGSELDRFKPRDQRIAQFVGYAFLNQETTPGHAELPGEDRDGQHDLGNRCFDIGIVE